MIHPISFSIPSEKIITGPVIKTKIMSDLIPGDMRTYVYNTETEYYDEYRRSYFAVTTKKAGWDCLRHYEILANGCIPYFGGIQHCPVFTMYLLPRDLFLRGGLLWDKFRTKTIDELTPELISEYNQLQKELLEYTKAHLTTEKMATYILNKSNHQNASKILYLSGRTDPDYLRCVTLHGFKQLLGTNCHDFPKIPHIYKSDTIDYSKLYGKGISYTNLLGQEMHDVTLNDELEAKIKSKFFDIIIYGSYHRGMPFYDLACETYKPSEIILLCGDDIHKCTFSQFTDKGHHVFVREL